MPDVGSQVLEVALGLVFIYFVFSLVCSALQELVSTILGWRAEHLERGLRQMLHGELSGERAVIDDLLDHPRIQELTKSSKLRKTKPLPSYISARTFSLTLLDTVAPPADAEQDSEDLIARARAKVAGLPPSEFKRKLSSMIEAAGEDVDRLRTEIEHWYDDAMNRVSGWYKRKSHVWLLVFGVVVVSAANVDTVQVVDRLWNDKTARAAVVAQADKAAQAQSTEELEEIAGDYQAVQALQLPVGWTTGGTDPDDPRRFPESINLMKILGLLLTALAVSFGAPFWFDALSKLGRLRATGKPEGRRPGTANP
jgi:hypothetical protein